MHTSLSANISLSALGGGEGRGEVGEPQAPGGGGRSVGVEAARRGVDEIDRDRRRRVIRLVLFGIVLDPVDQGLAGRREVRAARVPSVVRRRDRLRRVVRVGTGGRRGTAVEV